MLTRTSETAIHALLFLATADADTPTSPGTIASHIQASPSYLAKITSMLVKADILTAYRGVNGGVRLNRRPAQVRLLDIVQACQGNLFRDFTCSDEDLPYVCAYHKAMDEVQQAVSHVLGHWTLADIMARPVPVRDVQTTQPCRMECIKHLFASQEKATRV